MRINIDRRRHHLPYSLQFLVLEDAGLVLVYDKPACPRNEIERLQLPWSRFDENVSRKQRPLYRRATDLIHPMLLELRQVNRKSIQLQIFFHDLFVAAPGPDNVPAGNSVVKNHGFPFELSARGLLSRLPGRPHLQESFEE